jgi:hypothetical protein
MSDFKHGGKSSVKAQGATMAVLDTGYLFSKIEEARALINRSVLNKGEP